MKKVTLTFLAFAMFACFSIVQAQINTPAASPACKIEQTAGLTTITIEYSRPSVKGRTIFGGLEKYGNMWRTGANKNTIITFSAPVTISGKELKAGSYSLFTVLQPTEWEVIFYTDTENWGTPENYDAAKEAVRFKVPVTKLATPVETFRIDVQNLSNSSCTIDVAWEKSAISIPVGLNTDEVVNASIKQLFDGPTANDYYQAGRYYLDSDGDIIKAFEWLHKSNEMEPKFWRLRHESLALAKMGQYEKAIEVAKQSIAMAEEAGNKQYVTMNNESIAEWSKMKK